MILETIANGVRSFISERRTSSLDARVWADLGWVQQSSSGIAVTPESSMRISAVYACVRLYADTIAQLPISIMRENADGTSDKANSERIAKVLRTKPNLWQTSFEWRQMMQGHVTLRGNAYSRIVAGPMGAVDQLIPLNPGRMEVQKQTNGRLRYLYTNERGQPEVYTQDEIFHLRGLSSDGIKGLSPIQLARDIVGLSAAMERHGAGVFKNGARPAAVIKHPGRLNEIAAAKLRERWERIHSGVDNAGKTAVLEEGMDVTTLGMNSEDAQYIESREFQLSEIARIFRVPTHLIQDTRPGAVGYASVEQLSLVFVKFCLGPWLKTWEESAKRDLIVDDTLFLKFNLNALLRGDTTARGQFYKTLSDIGVFSPNDIRELEDLNPVEGGDQRFVALNMIPLTLAAEKAKADMQPPPTPPAPVQPPPVQPDPEPKDDTQTRELQHRVDFWHDEAATLALRKRELELKISSQSEESRKAREIRAKLEGELRDAEGKLVEFDHIAENLAKANDQIVSLTDRSQQSLSELAEVNQKIGLMQLSIKSATDHCLAMLVDCAGRMISWEIGAVQRAIKKPNFIAAIDEFYGEHEERFTNTMRCPCELYRSLTGFVVPCEDMVTRHLTESKNILLEAAGRATASTLADEITAVVESWPSRASHWTMIGTQHAA